MSLTERILDVLLNGGDGNVVSCRRDITTDADVVAFKNNVKSNGNPYFSLQHYACVLKDLYLLLYFFK